MKSRYLEKRFDINWFPYTWYFPADCKSDDCGVPVEYFTKGDAYEYWVYQQVGELDEDEDEDMEDVFTLTEYNFD